VVALIVILIVALALIAGAFARLLALRRQWRDEPPPKYSKPYRHWDDQDKR
jgi:hypothetical protein